MQEFNGNVACDKAAQEVVRMAPEGVKYACVPKGLLPVIR